MDIQTLLDKFWEGETTLEEEKLLRDYFAKGPVAPEHRPFAPFFQVLEAERHLEMSAVRLGHLQPQKGRKWRPFLLAAASAALLLLAGYGVWTNRATQPAPLVQHQPLSEDTFESPEEAAREIKAALALVSRKLNKGKEAVREKEMGHLKKIKPLKKGKF